MATKQEIFDTLLSFRIDMSGYPEAEETFDNYYKVLVHMLGLESELAKLLQVPRWEVEQSTRRAYEKYKAEQAAYAEKARRRSGNPRSEEERARRHTELYGSRSSLPPRGTGRSNPGHHSRNLKQSVAIGAGTGGVVYGLAKWKEDEVRRRLRISPELLGIISGAAGCGVSYYLI